MDPIEELLTRRVEKILPTKEELKEVLNSGKKIRLYQGFDPSSPNLHIGHLVGLLQLKAFQDLGHEVIFLIGDFTGMIGDPTDKSATRPKLTREQVLENAKTYQEQAGRILRFDGENPVQLKFNSQWSDSMTFKDLIELASNVTVQQMIERDMFQDRISQNKPIFLHEFLYPLAQGYDSVIMDVDLEVGGNDQMFNMMVGRQLMKSLKNKEKSVLTTKLLTDAEGRKIGKTTGNAINLFGDPKDLFGAIMSQPDSILDQGFELATTLPLKEIEILKQQRQTQPMEIKKRLAFEVVKLCQGETTAISAQTHFLTTFQTKSFANLPEFHLDLTEISVLDLLSKLGAGESNADKKRLIRDGAIALNNRKITD
ncbi:MAG TPA: tyrosine--tRNA ligase, partial [Anaerolineales bacterium]|nr:tyrosine--tRNA ligase [Anaerolineales bacterium]